MYKTEDLKDLHGYLKIAAKEALSKKQYEDSHTLLCVADQLEIIRFQPILFQTMVEEFEVEYALMEEPLDQVALHINDSGILSKTLVQWRCGYGV